jgi:membrane associated rhomboid family serine protease
MIPIGDTPRRNNKPIITVIIIAINTLIYLYSIGKPENFYTLFITKYGATPFEISRGIDIIPLIGFSVYYTLLTSMFIHASFWHLLGNMFFLWIFGDNVEDILGKIKYVFIYIIGGLVGSFIQIYSSPTSKIPLVGASGAISSLMGAYIILLPTASIRVLIPFIIPFIIQIPALVFILFWFLTQLISASSGSTSVGWWAHIGGFVCGMILALLFRSFKRKPPDVEIFYPDS